MKLLIITQYYPPEMGAPQARLSDLARRLHQRGHEVQVLTALPNYPTGSIFPGYAKLFAREKKEGITILRSWIIPSNRANLLHRLISYLSFAFSSLVTGALKADKADIIITESPPIFLAATGWLLSILKGARWILNISDLWPDSARDIGMLKDSGLAYRVLKALTLFFYKRAWLVTGQSAEIVSEIGKQCPAANTYVLSNGVDVQNFHPKLKSSDLRRKYLLPGEVGFIYAGLHGLFQGLDQVVMAAVKVQEEPVRFVFFGDGPEKAALIEKSRILGLRNLDFYPPIPHQQVPALLASMDVAIIPLKGRIRGAVPSKIYEAMAVEIPILLVAKGEASDIVERTESGLTVSPGDLDGLARAIRQLASNGNLRKSLGKTGRIAAENYYDRSKIAERFEEKIREDFLENASFTPPQGKVTPYER
jgi:glycosyltransferase involved in cell wall biosynthesis